MSSTSDIAAKWQQLLASGLDLGSPAGAEEDAGYGGRVQPYQNGRIYWHPQVGTYEVHGGILTEYLRIGGPGRHPIYGTRPLGFPKSDEHRTPDDFAQVSEFEWGAIFWGYGAGGVPCYGEFYPAWRQHKLNLGYPLTESLIGPDRNQVVFCSYGCLFSVPHAGVYPLYYHGPRCGRPEIAIPTQLSIASFTTLVLPGVAWNWIQSADPEFFTHLWQGRLILQSIPNRVRVPLAVEIASVSPYANTDSVVIELRITLGPGATMADRTLYDIAIMRPNGTTAVMSPHCVYAKTDWTHFGAMHATDIHVTERADEYHRRLVELGRTESLQNYNNYNEAFRDTIHYANKLHQQGILDLIIITGDLVDYQFEEWQNPQTHWGNFLYFDKIIRAAIGSPLNRSIEELRVPMFTTLGNHDYRQKAYKLLFDGEVPIFPDRTFRNFLPHNLTEDDARALQGGKPTVSSGDSLDMARKIFKPEYYYQRMNVLGDQLASKSYIVRLGPQNRLVMLDSGYDLGVLESTWDAFKVGYLGLGDEDRRSFAAGSPNQTGVTPQHLTLVEQALQEAGDGLVIVGIHGPPMNLKTSDFADFFRETEHASADSKDIVGYLIHASPDDFGLKQVPSQFGNVLMVGKRIQAIDWEPCFNIARSKHAGWMNSVGQPYFMRGTVSDQLDDAASKGMANNLLQMCAGHSAAGHAAPRPVDLLLCGHGHLNVEYRLRWDNSHSELQFFMDFYTTNPAAYYSTRKASWDNGNIHVGVRITPGAAPNPQPTNRFPDSQWEGTEWTIEVPPYPWPLDKSADPVTWWRDHRPLIMQTGAVGPREERSNSRHVSGKAKPDPSFQGFRILTVAFDTINAIHYVTLENLRARQFNLPWERLGGAFVWIRSARYSDRYINTQNGTAQCTIVQPRWLTPYWQIEPVGENVFRIRSRARPNEHLHIEHGTIECSPIRPEWVSARWTIQSIPLSDRCLIRNLWRPDRYLNVESGALEASALQDWTSAMWTIELPTAQRRAAAAGTE